MIPARLNVGVMLFFTLFFLYVLRANFSINMLAMVVAAPRFDANGTLIEQPNFGPRYNWTAYEQSLVLGAYFWGYALTSIPVGVLTDKYSFAKANIGYAFAVSVVLTVVAPWSASSLLCTVVLRFLMGLASGGIVPAINKIISQWSPPNEKGKFVATLFGTDIGTVVTWTACGVLAEKLGWQWAFYAPGIAAGLFTLLWSLVVYDSPAEHPRISAKERSYIENSLTGICADGQGGWPPFGQMLRSRPFWALLLLHYGHMWGMYFLLTAAPKFMNTVLGFDLASTGFLASFPYLFRLVTGLLFGALGDLIKERGWMSTTTVRKTATICSHILPGLLIVLIPYVGDDPYVCVACLTLSFGFNGAVSLTNYQNVHDLAPNYAGTIYAVINACATTSGFLSPLVVAFFTRNGNTIEEWSHIFMVGATIYIVPSLLFMLFGSADIQPWNDPKRAGSADDVSMDAKSPSATTTTTVAPKSDS